MQNLATLQSEGHFTGIGLSEVSSSTVQRANSLHPILAVENELSLFSLEPAILDTLQTCTELSIPLVGYSPLGKGMLTGEIKSVCISCLAWTLIKDGMQRFQAYSRG